MNEFYNKLETYLGKIKNIKRISLKCYLINAENKYIVKKKERNTKFIFDYLKSQGVDNVIYPQYVIKYNNDYFEIYSFVKEYDYPESKKVLNLKDALIEIQQKTLIRKRLSKKEYKKLYRLYQTLDIKFKILEMTVRKSEANLYKTDDDWILLSKYHIFLDAKKEMYKLQKMIHKYIDDRIEVDYSIIHNKPSLNHLINHQLISFEDAKLGVVVSDISKFYVLNEFVNIDWKSEIDGWLSIYESEFYKTYFKFLVLYIYMINFNIENNKMTIDSYLLFSTKIKKVLDTF